MSEQEEVEWMRKTARGDAAAFRALAGVHLGKIMNYAYRLLRDRNEAEDVVQETFLRLWKDAGRYEPKARVTTWLHRIAHNVAVDRLRRGRETPTSDLDEAPASFEPATLLQGKQTARAVEQALGELPERQRAAIALVYYQGLPNQEAAQVLGVSVDAFESLMARAKRTLKEKLMPFASEEVHGQESR